MVGNEEVASRAGIEPYEIRFKNRNVLPLNDREDLETSGGPRGYGVSAKFGEYCA